MCRLSLRHGDGTVPQLPSPHGDVSTPELLHTLAANAVAPFILVGWLRCALAPTEADKRFGHVINVSALEGKFSVGKKSGGHPHTNMAKAALNMLTCTCAGGYAQQVSRHWT